MTDDEDRNGTRPVKERAPFSRRDLLKALPAAGLVAAGAALAGPGAPQ
jgi:hypothetical protein